MNRVATWNTMNAFGPKEGIDQSRINAALAVIKLLDPDILHLSEFTDKRTVDVDEATEMAQAYGTSLGYSQSKTVDYLGSRNLQTMTMWVKDSIDAELGASICGDRNVLTAHDHTNGVFYLATHNDDRSPKKRDLAAWDQVKLTRRTDDPSVIVGDLNLMMRDDPKAVVPRQLSRVTSKIEMGDKIYDDSARLRRLAGKDLRVINFADPHTGDIYTSTGFTTADPSYQATLGVGPVNVTVDYILASRGLETSGFDVLDLSTHATGQRLSDHKPLSVDVNRA